MMHNIGQVVFDLEAALAGVVFDRVVRDERRFTFPSPVEKLADGADPRVDGLYRTSRFVDERIYSVAVGANLKPRLCDPIYRALH